MLNKWISSSWICRLRFDLTERGGHPSLFLATQYLSLPPLSWEFLTLSASMRQSLPPTVDAEDISGSLAQSYL